MTDAGGDAFLTDLPHIEAALRRAADRCAARHPALAQPVAYALQGGGKRIRPTLTLHAYRAAGGVARGEALYDLACAPELIHTYSLVHDDLPCMDDDDMRRGRPTLHRAFDGSTAVLAGALLIPLAFEQIEVAASALGLEAEVRTALHSELAFLAGAAGMVGGQWLDLRAEGATLSLTELERLHLLKTGALMAAALSFGAIAAGADDRVVGAFRSAGIMVGLAFQVHDDVLDETGDAAVLGKTAGKDRQHGKSTYPALLGLDGARGHAAQAADRAVDALRAVGITDAALEAIFRFAVTRDR